MVGADVNPYPILLLVNYWEIRPSQMSAHLGDLQRRGVKEFASFVPWQVVESDISHSLSRFLQAAVEREMKVFLIISPEMGIHYPNSGLPKDIISKKENRAQHSQAGKISINLPPNSFTLPSFFAPEFSKRYFSFMGRMDGLFADLLKSQLPIKKYVTAVLSGSFWKYYRSPLASSQSAFGGNAGDYSSHAALAYRQRVEHFFSQKEFMDPTPSSANRWKTRTLEEINRKWFYQQSEDVFRMRSFQMAKKKASNFKVVEVEVFTPEADPSLLYSNFLQMISGGHSDFSRLSVLVDEMAVRRSGSGSLPVPSYIHWSSMGGYRMLAESEKQFLILKSLLLVGAQEGGVLIDEAEWFGFSQQFRSRTEYLTRAMREGEFQHRNRVLYWVPHLWSSYGTLWDELVRKVGPGVKMVASQEFLLREEFSQLLIVDPSLIITKETLQRLVGWAKAGRVVVLPRSQLYSESARIELEKVLFQTRRIEVDLGLAYTLHSVGDGKLVIYNVPNVHSMSGEPLSSWQSFLNSILSLAEVEAFCRLSDSRLSVIPFERKKDQLAVFILNGTHRPVKVDIIFPKEVRIADLGLELSGRISPSDLEESEGSAEEAVSHRYALEVPAYGILPITVLGINLTESRERQIAAQTSGQVEANLSSAARSELPGFTPDESLGEIWN